MNVIDTKKKKYLRERKKMNRITSKGEGSTLTIHEVEIDHFGYPKWSKWSKSFRPLEVKSRNGRNDVISHDFLYIEKTKKIKNVRSRSISHRFVCNNYH